MELLPELWLFDGISIHALREEGDASGVAVVSGIGISIHALREEGDLKQCRKKKTIRKTISIHALREEGDSQIIDANFSGSEFLSTPSARRATMR